jgi:hypothetical protein
MPAGDWNFMAGRLDGDGGVEIIETELPIEIDGIERRLSAPSVLSGSITNKVKRLKNAGRPIFEPWNTVILAVAGDDDIRGYGAYRDATFNGAVWELDIAGLSSYPEGMPYIGIESFINADPLDIYRYIWFHLQAIQGGNIGVVLDQTTHTPVRVGTPTPAEGSTAEGPRVLSWWETTDMGAEADSLCSETPFDWLERYYFDEDGDPRTRIDFGYPTIGGRDTKRRIVLGENLAEEPSIAASPFLTGVHTLGSGEGRARIHGKAGGYNGRVRRVIAVDDQNLRTQTQADRAAARHLAAGQGQLTVESLEIYEHPNLPIDSIELGNEYALYAETDWATVDQFVRVVGVSADPLAGDRATVTVVYPEVV